MPSRVGYNLKQFKLHRKEQGIKTVTLKNNLSTLRVFLNWCVQAGLVDPKLPGMVQLPSLSDGDIVSDDTISLDRVETTIDYLAKYEYATRRHASFQLLWHTCMRIGTLQAIDIGDYYASGNYLEIRHRPETDTPLKNGNAAEREIQLGETMSGVLEDYIHGHRKQSSDQQGRDPLFTTNYGRLSDQRIRNALV